MATCTFAARLVIDLAVIVASPTIIDASRQRVTTATEDSARTARVCSLAAGLVEGVLGSVGTYDDTLATTGDQTALEIALRIALHLYLHNYSLIQTGETDVMYQNLLLELNLLNDRRSSAVSPQLGTLDLLTLDRLYPTTPSWNSEV